ncbi:pseudouridine synthase [Chloroflexota bacterium]
MAKEPLLKALTGAGIGSRRKMADLIREGRVEVNGGVVTGFNYPVDTARDEVVVDGRRVSLQAEKTVYLILNKPVGVLSTARDERGRRTVLDIIPDKYRRMRLYPVGRLDRDSTGLLLLTNDGELTYQLTHPKFEQEKEYLVRIEGRLRPEEKRKLERGIELDEGRAHPALVKEVMDAPPFTYSITIHEGKKRQIRRMFASLGYRVLELKRVRMGNLVLGELKEGKVRELGAQELHRLKVGK